MSDKDLKSVALAGKIIAILAWVFLPWFLGTYHNYNADHPIYLIENGCMAMLSILPNRWLVFSRLGYYVFLSISCVFLLVSLSGMLLSASVPGDMALIAVGLLVVVFLFIPLPLSLIFSRIRYRRGEIFIYA